MQKSLDLEVFINDHPMRPLQWLLIVLCFLILAVDGFDTASIGFIAPALVREWGIRPPDLAPVLTSALVGLAVGALFAGPLADRIGRKRVLVGSILVFGTGSLVSSVLGSLDQLILVRFLTGLGLGAAMPNATTLTSEYVPAGRRTFLVTLMFCGYTLGSALGGFVAAGLIPTFGWRSVFVVGGVVPLVLALALGFALPESAKYLAVRGRSPEEILRALRRLARPDELAGVEAFTVAEPLKPANARHPVTEILRPPLLPGTLLLWLTNFSGLAIVFLSTSWLPTLINQSGETISTAALVTAGFQGGGTVGALFVGWAMDRARPRSAAVLAVSYLLAGVFLLMIGHASTSILLLTLCIIGVGFFTSGAQTPLNAFGAQFYPTELRATGVSWMAGVGRFGAILGAFIGGPLLAAGWGFGAIFGLLAGSALVAALAIGAVSLIYRR